MAFFLRLAPTDAEILAMMRRGDERGVASLYHHCRPAVQSFLRRSGASDADLEDLLQEGVVIAWEQVHSGRFREESALLTFVLGVVKHLWFRRAAKNRRETPEDDISIADERLSVLEGMIQEEESSMLAKALEGLGDPCRRLLLLFYYEELSMEDIAQRLGFANAETAKAKKYQCKKLLQQRMNVRAKAAS